MKLQAGKIVAGRYKIDHILGAGGMAVVYRALDIKLDRYVTLKVLREELAADEDFVRRFPVEAMAAAALNHPNIVSIYDYGDDNDVYYIALEYIDGSSLKELITRRAPFNNDATLGLAIQIADGLTAAHRAEIIHRDVKPQNILVTNTSNAKVTDFGIARVAKAGTITTGESMGSAHYFSPEQARGGYVDDKTDIYSLGIVMFEMATGQLPFDGDNAVTVALMQINDPMPDILEINPDISDDVARIIYKATEKSPTRRYQNIEEMAADLKRALTGENGLGYYDALGSQSPADNDRPYDNEYYDEYEDEYKPEPILIPSEQDKRADRIAKLLGIAGGVVLALLIIWGAFAIYGRLRTVRITPPDVVGMTYSEAARMARDYRLTVTILETVFHNEVEYGLIIEQTPTHEHTEMSPGQAIQVTISMGPSPYVMPYIMGMHIDDAKYLLEDLPVEDIMVIDQEDEADPGTVIRQDPEEGAPIGEGTVIIIYISQGGEEAEAHEAIVPRLIFLTQDEALEALREANLLPGVILHEESTTITSGLIFLQYPLAGEVVEPETRVGFTVSTGSPLPATPAPTATPEPTPYPQEPDDTDQDPPDDPGQDITDPDDDPGDDQYPDDSHPDIPDPPPDFIASTISIPLWDVPEDTESVHLHVTRQTMDGTLTVVASYHVPVANFPVNMRVEGIGLVSFRIYHMIDGQAHFIDSILYVFDE